MHQPIARLHSLRSVQLRVPTLSESSDFYSEVWGLSVVEHDREAMESIVVDAYPPSTKRAAPASTIRRRVRRACSSRSSERYGRGDSLIERGSEKRLRRSIASVV